MSVNKDLRWLRAPGLKGPAKRFVEFCKTDIPQQSKIDPGFDIRIYREVAQLITQKLQMPSTSDIPIKDGRN